MHDGTERVGVLQRKREDGRVKRRVLVEPAHDAILPAVVDVELSLVRLT
jgi:hypothetical protein